MIAKKKKVFRQKEIVAKVCLVALQISGCPRDWHLPLHCFFQVALTQLETQAGVFLSFPGLHGTKSRHTGQGEPQHVPVVQMQPRFSSASNSCATTAQSQVKLPAVLQQERTCLGIMPLRENTLSLSPSYSYVVLAFFKVKFASARFQHC